MAQLECDNLCLGYPTTGGWKPVVRGVSFSVETGCNLAIVGESGSGKSTIAKALVKLIPVREGSILLDGKEVAPLSGAAFAPYRKVIQLVFQDPWQALNPRLSAEQLLTEPLEIHFSLDKGQRNHRIRELLESVHLPENILSRLPSELSGGQRQRILIARALAVDPQILVCDEPVSALDVSIQARLLELLMEIRKQRNLTMIFISHDLAVVQKMADHVLVLQGGTVVESQPTRSLFRNPRHDYTKMLISACPKW